MRRHASPCKGKGEAEKKGPGALPVVCFTKQCVLSGSRVSCLEIVLLGSAACYFTCSAAPSALSKLFLYTQGLLQAPALLLLFLRLCCACERLVQPVYLSPLPAPF